MVETGTTVSVRGEGGGGMKEELAVMGNQSYATCGQRRMNMSGIRIAAAIAALNSVLAVGAVAEPLAPGKPSEVVTAVARRSSSPSLPASPPCPGVEGHPVLVATRANADGTSSPFSIPPKSVFVVTSFAFAFSVPAFGERIVILFAVDPANPPAGDILSFGALTFASAGDADVGHAQVSPGLIIKPPAVLCVSMPGGEGTAVVHGFLADDK